MEGATALTTGARALLSRAGTGAGSASHGGTLLSGPAVAIWGPPLGVIIALALSLLMRFPALTWPLNQQRDAPCCGHPDERVHYVLSRRFQREADQRPYSYPPGLAYLTYIGERTGLGRLADALAPPGAGGAKRQQIRGIYTARLISLLFSVLGIWLMYALCRQAGLSRWLASCGAAFLAFSPLFSVHSIYGLADVPNAVLVLASVALFLRWCERPAATLLAAFALLTGAAFAVKLGVTIGLALAPRILVTSHRRMRDLALLVGGGAAGAVLTSGGSLTPGQLTSISRTVEVTMWGVETSLPWNMVHHLGSVITGLGWLFAIVLAASLLGWRSWVREAGRPDWRRTLTSPWSALAAGCVLTFLVICQSSSAFTRQMLVLYPYVVLFAMAGISRLGPLRALQDAPQDGRWTAPNLAGAAALALVTSYGSMAAWPVLGSFSDDPNLRAAAWLQAHTDGDDRIDFTQYAERAKQSFDRAPARPGDGRTRELLVIHSHWVERLTGRWWLKPAPASLAETKRPPTEDPRVLSSWQRVMAGHPTGLRIVATFGHDWWTPERAFLSLVGRGYDQFVTTGQVYIVERERTAP